MSINDFEEEREQNIARNKALLAQLGIGSNEVLQFKKPRPAARQERSTKSNKRKADNDDNSSQEHRPAKAAAVAETEGGVRRSGRNAGKKVNYRDDGELAGARSRPQLISEAARNAEDNEPRESMNRTNDPKKYGSIPGIEVGTWWETRQACSADAIHAPWVAGISAGPEGCYSVALSGGYEDDVDLGEGFTYTGSGGRDLKGTRHNPKNLRTAPQSCDQSFENNFNRSLQLSVETRKPVRVIRGFKLHSRYAPPEGYRYDGLYTVEKAWMESGLNKQRFKVCKFLFKRIPGQPPLPVYQPSTEDLDDKDSSATEADDSGFTQSETAVESVPSDNE